VMQLNAEDGGNRKFIMVQLPERTDEKSEAYKAGYKNICEIGKERIRRAGAKIRNEQLGMRNGQSSLFENNASSLDTGFRVLKLDSSNMEDVYYSPEEFNSQMLFQENVKADRTEEDLLFQVMLELGIELSASIRKERLGTQNATVFNVDNGYLMATFARDIDEETITEIAKCKPVYFVMWDASAASDNVMDNFEQLFRYYSPETTCRMI
ncbi:MAG: site-specific DNA-methyltransferase, partial [Parabacteroides sp.]